MRQFKYNVTDLIEGIRHRPCIWDKSCESYKDRVERRCAWEEIFNKLEKDFESMTAEQRRFVEEQIVTKWTNIRDTFYKSLKVKLGRPKRKYVLYDQLKFLIGDTPQEGAFDEQANEVYSTNGDFTVSHKEEYLEEEEEEEQEPEPVPKKKSRRTKDLLSKLSKSNVELVEDNYDNLTNEFVTCDVANESRLMNEDEAFFASLLPTVVRYTVDERLDFRVEVLNVMKKIQTRRNEAM